MTTKVVAEFNCADGNTEKFVQMCRELFLETRCINGCESIDIPIDTDDENLLRMTENRKSNEHHQAYASFRTEDDSLRKIGALLSGLLSFRISHRPMPKRFAILRGRMPLWSEDFFTG